MRLDEVAPYLFHQIQKELKLDSQVGETNTWLRLNVNQVNKISESYVS